ncbi:MAG: phage tail protein [Verrucomicrobiota bacterium]
MPTDTNKRDFGGPFMAFNFEVAFKNSDKQLVCGGAFAECDGLEMNMSVKTIKEGGNNSQSIHLLGPATYGQLTLKRGMSPDAGLWRWFEHAYINGNEGVRLDGEIVLLSTYGARDFNGKNDEVAVFLLTGCLPTKVKAPGFNAKDGQVAIEELQIAYERLQIQTTEPESSFKFEKN